MEGRLEPVDQEYIRKRWEETWGLPVVSIDRNYTPEDVSGLCWRDEWGEAQGLITWHIEGDRAEIVTLDAYQQGRHIGGRLLDGAEAELRRRSVHQVRIVTTNDNLRAIAFYLRRGYRIVRVELDGMDRVRKLKPGIPERGLDGIPLRDMFELHKHLGEGPAGGGSNRIPEGARPESFT
jgi:GNAT superfamily N-acetyltransferase